MGGACSTFLIPLRMYTRYYRSWWLEEGIPSFPQPSGLWLFGAPWPWHSRSDLFHPARWAWAAFLASSSRHGSQCGFQHQWHRRWRRRMATTHEGSISGMHWGPGWSLVRLSVVCWVFFSAQFVKQVNGRRLHNPETVELQHLDRVVLGRSVCLVYSMATSFKTYDCINVHEQFQVDLLKIWSGGADRWNFTHFETQSVWRSEKTVRCLYAFLKPGSSIHDLPADKLPMARPSQQESLILDILGKERAEEPGQLQMALKFMSELKQTLGEFVVTAVSCHHRCRDFWFQQPGSFKTSRQISRIRSRQDTEASWSAKAKEFCRLAWTQPCFQAALPEMEKTDCATPWASNKTISRQTNCVKRFQGHSSPKKLQNKLGQGTMGWVAFSRRMTWNNCCDSPSRSHFESPCNNYWKGCTGHGNPATY